MKKRILYSMLGAVIATALVFTFVVQLVQTNFPVSYTHLTLPTKA